MKRFKFLSVLAASIVLIGLLWTVSDPQTTRTFIAKELPLVIDSVGPHSLGGSLTFPNIDNYVIAGGDSSSNMKLGFYKKAGVVGPNIAAASTTDITFGFVDTASLEPPTSNTFTERMRLTTVGILALGTTVTTGAAAGDFISTKGWTTEAAGAAHGNAAANAVTIYIREDIDVGAGTATADCAIRARKSDGSEVNIVTLVTDGGCP